MTEDTQVIRFDPLDANGECSPQEVIFVHEYLKDFNGTRAAEVAGWGGTYGSRAVQAHTALKRPRVAALVAVYVQTRAMSSHEFLLTLADQARGLPGEFFKSNGREVSIDVDRLVKEKPHLIRRVKTTKYGQEIEFHDPQKALEMLGKAMGMFTQRVEAFNVNVDLNDVLAALPDAIRSQVAMALQNKLSGGG